MVYALLAEKVRAERQVNAVLIAAGADLEMPSLHDLDVAIGLVEKPGLDLSPWQRELRQELGLRV